MSASLRAAEPARADSALPPELEPLVRSLGWANGLVVDFVQCNVPAESKRLAGLLVHRLAEIGKRGKIVEIEASEVDLLATLRARQAGAKEPADVLLVVGFERVIPADVDHPPSLAIVNMARELFHDLAVPIVLFLPDYALVKLAREAPDFWAWRSSVFEVDLGERRVQELLSGVSFAMSGTLGALSPDRRRGHVETLRGLLADIPRGPSADRIELLARLGRLEAEDGDFEAANRDASDGVELARQAGDEGLLARALVEHAFVQSVAGLRSHAIGSIGEAVSLWRRLAEGNCVSYGPRLIDGLFALAGFLVTAGDSRSAISATREAVRVARRLEEETGGGYGPLFARALAVLGTTLARSGRAAGAAKSVEEAVDRLRRLDRQRPGSVDAELAAVLVEKARIDDALGRGVESIEAASEAVEILRRVRGSPADLIAALSILAAALGEVGRWDEAREAVEEAGRLLDAIPGGGPELRAAHFVRHAEILEALGDAREAASRAEKALDILRPLAERDAEAYGAPLASLERWHATLTGSNAA